MQRRHFRIFLSSPSDVGTERQRAEAVVQALDAEFKEIDLELVRWEDSVYRATSTFQDQIIDPRECDLVVSLFWYRLGSPLPPQYDRPDGTSRSGTEYEFERAIGVATLAGDEELAEPPDVLVYRKTAPLPDDSESTKTEFRALENFWQRWFRDEEGHYLAAFDTFGDGDEFADRFERHLRRWLDEQRETTWDVSLQGSPFRGLEAFDESHSAVFFGRSREVERARARLMAAAERGASSLLLIGASGSGKSSLMRAGLIPRLMVPDSTAPLVERWRRLVIRPGELGTDVPTALTRSLFRNDVLPGLEATITHQDLVDSLADKPAHAAEAIVTALDAWADQLAASEGRGRRPVTGLVVGIDQLEELFQLEENERERFLRILDRLVHDPRIWVVATLRSDFYPSLQEDPRLIALKDGGRVLDIPPPSPADIRAMIEGAAGAAGLRLEDDGERNLAELLERDAGEPGSLPMLQFALQALFESRDQDQGLLRLADYDALGGAAGALATEAERVLAELGEAGETAFDRILWRLVDVPAEAGSHAPHARSVSVDVFPADTHERRLVDGLLKARLLIAWADTTESSRYVRVAHESLFRDWPRAAERIARFRRDLETRARLEQSRELWLEADENEKPQRLLRGLGMEEARDLDRRWGEALPEELREYIHASHRASRDRQRRRQGLVASIVLVMAGLAGSATWFGITADQERQRAEQARAETEQAHEQSEQVTELQQELLEDMEPAAIAGGITEQLHAEVENADQPEELREALAVVSANTSLIDISRNVLANVVLAPVHERMEERLRDDPAVHGRLEQALAEIYQEWGDYDQAEAVAAQADTRLQEVFEEVDTPRMETGLVQASVLLSQREVEEAKQLIESVLETANEELESHHPLILRYQYQLANAYRLTGETEEGIALIEEVVDGYGEVLGHDDEKTLRAQNLQATLLEDAGRVEEAVAILEEVIETGREALGATHPDRIAAMQNLAGYRYRNEEYEAALELQQQVVDGHREQYGEMHPDPLQAQSNLALLYQGMGRLEEAEEKQQQAYQAERRLLGENDPGTLTSMILLANIWQQQGEHEQVIDQLSAELERLSDVFGDRHWRKLGAVISLTKSLEATGDRDAARELFEEHLLWLLEEDTDTLNARERELREELESLETYEVIAEE